VIQTALKAKRLIFSVAILTSIHRNEFSVRL